MWRRERRAGCGREREWRRERRWNFGDEREWRDEWERGRRSWGKQGRRHGRERWDGRECGRRKWGDDADERDLRAPSGPGGTELEVTPDQADELPGIVRDAPAGSTILLADGIYRMTGAERPSAGSRL